MWNIITSCLVLFLAYIFICSFLNSVQLFAFGGINIKLKNKKLIGKEQPIYYIDNDKRISKYVIDHVLCEDLNILFILFVPILFIFKKLDYTRVGGFYITDSEYDSITTSDGLEKLYNKYLHELNEVRLVESENELKMKKLNEKFTKNYGKQ